MKNEDYWRTYYASHKQQKPSKFAKWVKPRLAGGPVLDVGCGDGRDTVYLGAEGWDPYAPEGEAFRRGTWRNMLRHYPRTLGMSLYARWFLHSIPAVEEGELLRKWRGEVFIEGRVEGDVVDDTHYRRPHDVDKLVDALTLYGYHIVYQKTARSFSPKGEDKPLLVRIHATPWT